ncbi:MAG: lysophospholipid acyltransferase family protein [Sulfuricurvum sp.]|uniref:lysophospholipid acyltransferase family protein n=1 Tax=Sulfuricurvum sp. TaxID=2025608 RepID=UPI00260940A1|nr:lysophospholipid acyltransferase family protein [Sulfuricurvum sp.]MDD2828255.1 lysophospholipid acyltransferase family protein [Sulfuricurvum sp.]MDD4949790.1 lysophospholipid acyltransferase family protein [Sulfuricurvum sp.]
MRKRFLRAFSLWSLPLIGSLLIRLIYATSKKRFHLPSTIPNEPVIFASWHGSLLMQPYLYYHFRSIPKAKVIISEHFDGQIIAGVIKFFGLESIYGSSTRGGAKVLIQGLKALDEGYDIGITPDGPKGPRYSVSDGVVVLAQKRQTKVIAVHCQPSRYWQLSSWDRFVVPKPFGTLDFYASEPIDLTGLEIEEAKKILYDALMEHPL